MPCGHSVQYIHPNVFLHCTIIRACLHKHSFWSRNKMFCNFIVSKNTWDELKQRFWHFEAIHTYIAKILFWPDDTRQIVNTRLSSNKIKSYTFCFCITLSKSKSWTQTLSRRSWKWWFRHYNAFNIKP